MAISSKIEEILLEITKNIGNISDALNIGVGDIDIPGSAIFEINNLKSTAETGYPYFGIIETSPLSFNTTYDLNNDQFNVSISSGTFSYNGSLNQVTAQKIPIKKEFLKDYSVYLDPSVYKYGITIGLSIDEAKKTTQTFNTKTTVNASSGSTFIYVNSTGTADSLGYPIEAHVGSIYLKFNGSGFGNTALFIDPNYYTGAGYGTLPNSVASGSAVKFVYQPKLSYIAGFPISTNSSDPTIYNYFPPIPTSWLPIAKVLVEDPTNPVVAGNENDSIIRTVVDMPTANSENPILGDSDDIADVINYCNSTINNLKSYKNDYSINSFINAVNQYSNYLAGQDNISVNEYWSKQPFRPTQYYSKGLSFSGLERFEFPANFSSAYYNVTGTDLQHTFGTFRGDLVTYNSAVLGSATIGTNDITTTVLTVPSFNSNLKSGTQIYGISAVCSVDGTHYEETAPSYVSVISTNTTNESYAVDLSWTGIGLTNPLFYNVYKRVSTNSEIVEKKLTNSNEVIFPPYNLETGISDNTNFVLTDKTYAININNGTDCYIGGVKLKIGYNAPGQSATGSSGLNFKVFAGDITGPNYLTQQYATSKLLYSDIKSGTNEYNIVFSQGFNASAGDLNWLVIEKDSDFSVGTGLTDLYIRVLNSGSNEIYSYNGVFDQFSSWNSETGIAYIVPLNFVDNGTITTSSINRGIKLTNRISNTARRLSVYVPPVDDIVDNTGLFFNGSTVAIASTTDKTIKNDLVVSVTAKLGENGTEKTLTTTVPKGTDRDTRFLLGTASDLFDRVVNISVIPGSNLTRITNGPILWDIYDLITVETAP